MNKINNNIITHELEEKFKTCKFKNVKLKQKSIDEEIIPKLTETINDKYVYLKNCCLDSESCKEIIKEFEMDNNRQKGRFGFNTIDIKVKDTVDLNISTSIKWKKHDIIVFEKLKENILEYISNLLKINTHA
jgi:hypothetical protein